MKDVCQRIRSFAEAGGMTKAELHRKTGLSYRGLVDIWALRARPRMDTLVKIASALGVPVAALLGNTREHSDVDSALMVREPSVQYGKPAPEKTAAVLMPMDEMIRQLSLQLAVPEKEVLEWVVTVMEKKRGKQS